MKAIILAAGTSTRTYPLTVTRPKPLLPIAGIPIIHRTLDALQGLVEEVIIVVNYKQDMIKQAVGDTYKDLKITYITQEPIAGTAHALAQCKEYLTEKFLLILGDNVYCKEDLEQCLTQDCAILTAKVPNPSEYGVVSLNEHHHITSIIEKPEVPPTDLAIAGVYTLPLSLLSLLDSLQETERGEIELPDALNGLIKTTNITSVVATKHAFIGYPWDLLTADRMFRTQDTCIGTDTEITGSVTNSSIGNNCTIKGTVKNSLILDNTIVEAESIITDSVIGENVVFKGIVQAQNTTKTIKGKQVQTGLFGTAIGDGVSAMDTLIKPGVRIWPTHTVTGEQKEDIQ